MAETLSFKFVQAAALSKQPAKVIIRWGMNLSGAALANYQFFIERGEFSDNQPGFQNIDIYQQPLPPEPSTTTNNMQTISRAVDGLDNQWYLDFSPELLNLSKPLVYRVRCRNKATQEEFRSDTVNFTGADDLIAIYIIDEINFELSDATGTPCLTYNRKRTGVPCKCFDPVQKKRSVSGCLSCYDTNWVGGFYDPVDSFIDFTPNPKTVAITQWGEVQENETRALLTNFPNIYPGDVIREILGNRMWRVVKVPISEKRRTLVLQLPVLTEIKPGDVEYKIPVDEQFLLAKLKEFEYIKKRREF